MRLSNRMLGLLMLYKVLIGEFCMMYSNLLMLQRKKLIFISFLLSAILCFGCSILGGSKALAPYSNYDGWTEITREDSIYTYKYACGPSLIRVREIHIGRWGFFGPPLAPVIPIIPLPVKGEKNLLFDIHISNSDQKLPDKPIALELLIPSKKQTYLPVETINLQEDLSVIEKEGLHGTDFILAEEGGAGMTYLYKFDLDRKDIEEFEIIFLSGLNGCSIPNISYKQKTKKIYEPFVIPHPV